MGWARRPRRQPAASSPRSPGWRGRRRPPGSRSRRPRSRPGAIGSVRVDLRGRVDGVERTAARGRSRRRRRVDRATTACGQRRSALVGRRRRSEGRTGRALRSRRLRAPRSPSRRPWWRSAAAWARPRPIVGEPQQPGSAGSPGMSLPGRTRPGGRARWAAVGRSRGIDGPRSGMRTGWTDRREARATGNAATRPAVVLASCSSRSAWASVGAHHQVQPGACISRAAGAMGEGFAGEWRPQPGHAIATCGRGGDRIDRDCHRSHCMEAPGSRRTCALRSPGAVRDACNPDDFSAIDGLTVVAVTYPDHSAADD